MRVETSLNPDLASNPMAVLRGWDEHVRDASPDVIEVGVGVGDSRRRVEQLCPQAIIIPAREETYQSHHDLLRSILLNFANGVEAFALGELFIEVGALMRAFPSEAALAFHLVQSAERATQLSVTLELNGLKASVLVMEDVNDVFLPMMMR